MARDASQAVAAILEAGVAGMAPLTDRTSIIRRLIRHPAVISVGLVCLLFARLVYRQCPRSAQDGAIHVLLHGIVPNYGKSSYDGIKRRRDMEPDSTRRLMLGQLLQAHQILSEMLVVDGGGVTLFCNPGFGLYHSWNPAPAEHLHDAMDIYDAEMLPTPNGPARWKKGRLLLGGCGTVWLYDLSKAGRPGCGRAWIRGEGLVLHCRWAANGERLSFTRLTRRGSQIWVADYPSGEARHVPALDGFIDPVLSPDGTQLACAKDGDIWVAQQDGSRLRRLGLKGARWPAWHPRATRLAFQRWQGGQWDIWTYDFGTGASTRLTWSPEWDVYPSWSDDGQWIAFGSLRGGRWGIWLKRSTAVPGQGPPRIPAGGSATPGRVS